MLRFQYPYPTAFAQLAHSVRIAYIDEGRRDGVPLLFIHGLGSYLAAWKKNVDVLRQHFRCIAVDLPGYAKSSKPNLPYSMSFFADSMVQFLEKMSLEKAIFVGHSMGGQVAMTLALNRPDLVEKLVLVAPAGIETFHEQEVAWFKSIVTTEILKNTPVEQIKKNFDVNFAAGITPDDALFMYQDRLDMREAATEYDHYCRMIPQCVAGMLDEPVFDRLPSLQPSTLLLFGAQDYLIPNQFLHPDWSVATVAEAAQGAIPNSSLAMIPNAGHFAMWDNAAVVNEKITNFCW